MGRRLQTQPIRKPSRAPGCMRVRAVLAVALVSVSLGPVSVLGAANDLVTIKGGADSTCHNYSWTVTNHHTSPIVYIEFPHYRADGFFVPPGWESETTYLVNIGVPDRPGVCIARPEASRTGIVQGSSREFGMRIAAPRAPLGSGTVIVRFADGTETKVAGVELPEPPVVGAKYIPLIGTAILFAGWVAIRTIRQRRKAAAMPTTNSDREEAEE